MEAIDTLSLDDFKVLDISDQPTFRDLHGEIPHSDYLFSTMFSWGDYMEYSHTIVGDNIVLLTRLDDWSCLRPPIGPWNEELMDEVIGLAREHGLYLSMIWPFAKEKIEGSFPDIRFEPLRDYYDYIYSSRDLADLPGKPYLKVRNQINRFRGNYRYEVEKVDHSNFDEVHDLIDEWCRMKDCEGDPSLKGEKTAVQISINNMFDLNLSGLALRINDKLEAVSIFEEMNHDMAVIHFEKAMPRYKGIYQAINNETAMELADRYTYINRESDMGVPGLRFAKEKYRPHHMLEVYFAKL